MHLNREKILAYVTGNLSDEECFHIDIHLAECGECARRVNAFYNLRADFESIIDKAKPKKLAENFFLFRLKKALQFIAEEKPALRNKIKGWLKKLSMKSEVVFGFILDPSKKSVQPVLQGIRELMVGGAVPFHPLPSAPRILGTGLSSCTLSVEAKSELRPKITIDPIARKVLVQINERKKPWPLAIIFAADSKTALASEFRHPEGTDFLLSEFEDIPAGKYFLVLEPEGEDGNWDATGDVADHRDWKK